MTLVRSGILNNLLYPIFRPKIRFEMPSFDNHRESKIFYNFSIFLHPWTFLEQGKF